MRPITRVAALPRREECFRGNALLIAGTLALCASSCTDASREFVVWTVRDSAGVEIHESGGSAPVWRLADGALLELGAVDEPGPLQFYRVRDVELLQDNGLAVANQGSEELRIFSEDGVLRATVGGRGHGPQEFDGLAMIESFGDSLLTWDGGNQRLSVRQLDGSLARTFGLERIDGLLFPVAVLEGTGHPRDRGILTVTARYMSQLRGSGLVVDTALVSVYSLDGTLVDSLARVPHNGRAVLRLGNLQTTLGAPYLADAPLVGDGHGFCHTFGSVPEIRCRNREGLSRVVRVELPVRSVTKEDVDHWWTHALETSNERRRDALRRMRDVLPFPTAFPAFDALLRDDQNRLWARRYRMPEETSERWLVFESGKWVAQLDTPVGYQVMDVRRDRIAGVWRDPVGVEFVRVYRFLTN